MRARLHAVVSGRVQGVAFRSFVERRAAELDVTGWVRNLPDGRVEALAEGETERLKRFLDRLREGPSLSRVTDVEVDWAEDRGEFADFRIVFPGY